MERAGEYETFTYSLFTDLNNLLTQLIEQLIELRPLAIGIKDIVTEH